MLAAEGPAADLGPGLTWPTAKFSSWTTPHDRMV
jgi:hypothetical protein